MSDHREEMISILLDGELDAAETAKLLNEFGSNPQSRCRLERYQLISDTVRNQLPDLLNHNLSLRITQAIAREDVHSSNIKTLSEPLHSGWRVTGFALAASLAAMAVVGVQWYQPDTAFVPGQLASAPGIVPASVPVEIVSSQPLAAAGDMVQLVANGQSTTPPGNAVSVVSGDPAHWKVLRSTSPPRLTEYLINHNEYSSPVPVRDGMMPQVRVVGYASGE